MPSYDDTYQENKYHKYKSCINKDLITHKESSSYQLLEPDIFNNRNNI